MIWDKGKVNLEMGALSTLTVMINAVANRAVCAIGCSYIHTWSNGGINQYIEIQSSVHWIFLHASTIHWSLYS